MSERTRAPAVTCDLYQDTYFQARVNRIAITVVDRARDPGWSMVE